MLADSTPDPARPVKPEVLSPAGGPEALQAAIGGGADAVYFGLTDYNARVRARNFELGDLPDVLTDLRRWGVRSYLTFNTLIFLEEELAARQALEAIAAAGPDGIIVQDLGVVRWARQIAPSLPIHASTQMTVSSAEGIALVERLGVRRVILARELTLAEIARIRAATSMELEVFVHGALCVSYSGQCLSSEAWGGRSANRGQCAQACRLPYDLWVDGEERDLGDRTYLLSPKDLEGYRRIPELTSLGISAVKIEGRMKSAEYVAAATALYRRAVDAAWNAHLLALAGNGDSSPMRTAAYPGSPGRAEQSEERRDQPKLALRSTAQAGLPTVAIRDRKLEGLAQEARQVFSRGASEGFLGGVNHQVLVNGTTRSHRGLLIGSVVEVNRGGKRSANALSPEIVIELARPRPGCPAVNLLPGDGLLLAASPREEDEVGGRIAKVASGEKPHHLRVSFARESMPDLQSVRPGTPVFRTASPALAARLHRAAAHPESSRRVPLAFTTSGRLGELLSVTVTDPEGRSVTVHSALALARAETNALNSELLQEQLGRLGTTRYRLASLESSVEDRLFLPISELNRLRRDAIRQLEGERGRPLEACSSTQAPSPQKDSGEETVGAEGPSPILWALAQVTAQDQNPSAMTVPPMTVPPMTVAPMTAPARQTQAASRASAVFPAASAFEESFLVLCRDRAQVEGALQAGARRVVLDFLDLKGLKDAALLLRASDARVSLALPRIQKPGEEKIESYFVGLGPEELLVRSLGSLERLGRLRGMAQENGRERFPLLVGDVSLNAVNPTSIETLLGLGLARVSPGLDLNGEQLEHLVERVDASRIEVPLHHHLPVFHTEHCVFAAFLSGGADFRTCGRPCDRHQIALRDRTGQAHPVVADVGCRNTVFSGRPQSGLPHLDSLRRSGVDAFRIELIDEDANESARTIRLYRDVWTGSRSWTDALTALKAEGRYGISTGSPELPRKLLLKPVGGRREAKANPLRGGNGGKLQSLRGDDGGKLKPVRGRERAKGRPVRGCDRTRPKPVRNAARPKPVGVRNAATPKPASGRERSKSTPKGRVTGNRTRAAGHGREEGSSPNRIRN